MSDLAPRPRRRLLLAAPLGVAALGGLGFWLSLIHISEPTRPY